MPFEFGTDSESIILPLVIFLGRYIVLVVIGTTTVTSLPVPDREISKRSVPSHENTCERQLSTEQLTYLQGSLNGIKTAVTDAYAYLHRETNILDLLRSEFVLINPNLSSINNNAFDIRITIPENTDYSSTLSVDEVRDYYETLDKEDLYLNLTIGRLNQRNNIHRIMVVLNKTGQWIRRVKNALKAFIDTKCGVGNVQFATPERGSDFNNSMSDQRNGMEGVQAYILMRDIKSGFAMLKERLD